TSTAMTSVWTSHADALHTLRLVDRRSWRVLMVALAIVALAAPLGIHVHEHLKPRGFDGAGSGSAKAREAVAGASGTAPADSVLALVRLPAPYGTPTARRTVADVEAKLRRDPAVVAVLDAAGARNPAMISSGRRSTYAVAAPTCLSPRAVVAEPFGEKRQRVLAAPAHLATKSASIGRARRELFADVRDQRAVDADQRVSNHVRPQVAASGAGLVGDQLGQRVGVAGEDLLFPREQRRAGGDHSCHRDQFAGGSIVLSCEKPARFEDELTERGEQRLAVGALADRGEQPLLESLEAAKDQVLLAREVVENRLLPHLRFTGDLGDAHLLEAALAEQAAGGFGEQLPRPLFLPLPESQLGCHQPHCSTTNLVSQ